MSRRRWHCSGLGDSNNGRFICRLITVNDDRLVLILAGSAATDATEDYDEPKDHDGSRTRNYRG